MSYTSNKTAGSRSLGLGVVVALHIILIWGLASGLASTATKQAAELMQVVLDEAPEEEVAEEAPPPPPPENIPPPPIDQVIIPEMTMVVDVPTNYSPPVVVTQTANPVAPVTTKPAQAPKKGYSLPDYPPASLRLEEEGTVQLQLYLNEEGKVVEAKVAESSGFPRLDEASVKHAKRAWKLVPCMEGDKPVACWHTMKLKWQMPK